MHCKDNTNWPVVAVLAARRSPRRSFNEEFSVKRYRCTVCNQEFDEDQAAKTEDGEMRCPICGAPASMLLEITPKNEKAGQGEQSSSSGRETQSELLKAEKHIRHMDDIHHMAQTGESIVGAMGVSELSPSWDDILILGAQLDPMPLENHEEVETETIIGRHAKMPLVLKSPIYISHMSFGALSKEAKIALAKGSALAKTATGGGEGGILKEEMDAAYKYIFEYIPNLYSVTPDNLKNADAIEIKIGQGTKPGLGGHLPGVKVTPEIAAVRGKAVGQDIHSPSKFHDVNSRDDMKALVEKLRTESQGRPIGIKIAAGRIECDLAVCVFAEPDFITIDGRGGSTAASPKLVRDTTSVPTIYALHRARKYLDSVSSDISLVITGGLRVSSDFAKAIAMGADAVAISTAALMALGCQQYRICNSGKCPVGIATQNVELRARLDIDLAARRLANFLNVSLAELQNFARLTGHKDIHGLCSDDLCTTSREISDFTNIAHV